MKGASTTRYDTPLPNEVCMPCPFPGMDPYIERAALWPDFHDRLIAGFCGTLNPLLRPKYAALTQDRLYVIESDRAIFPDVGVIRTRLTGNISSTAAVLEPDAAVVFELGEEELREPYIEIIEPAAGNRIVTAIEVLSPTNKTRGEPQDAYIQKRRELWASGVNLVEIDLLRGGEKTVRVPSRRLDELLPWHYLVAITRRKPFREEVYPIRLEVRLPRIGIPLSPQDNDVVVDLQAVFTRCWNEGAYPELLRYDEPPLGRLAPDEITWCAARIASQGASERG